MQRRLLNSAVPADCDDLMDVTGHAWSSPSWGFQLVPLASPLLPEQLGSVVLFILVFLLRTVILVGIIIS